MGHRQYRCDGAGTVKYRACSVRVAWIRFLGLETTRKDHIGLGQTNGLAQSDSRKHWALLCLLPAVAFKLERYADSTQRAWHRHCCLQPGCLAEAHNTGQGALKTKPGSIGQ